MSSASTTPSTTSTAGTAVGDALLGDLNEAQRVAVTSGAARLAVIAGAGSGKTRVLTHRIAWLAATGSVDARRTLAVTFTRKAAGELSERLGRLGLRDRVTAGTFHAMALAQLRRRALDVGRRPPVVVDRPARLVAAAVRRVRPDAPAALVGLVARELDWARALGLDAEHWADAARRAGRPVVLDDEELRVVATAYEREKRRRGVVDFHDLVEHLSSALAGDAEFAAAQRWRHRHLFVDEFQDVSPAQFRLLEQWTGPDTTLTVVGDDRQSIYGFAGADARYLARFAEWCPDGETVVLTTNHRSTPQIQEVAASVLPPDPRPTDRHTSRPDGSWPVVTGYPDEDAEAHGVAAAASRLVAAGRSPGAIAVLARTNAQTPLLHRALIAAGLPVHRPAASGLLHEPAVAAVIDELQRAARRAPGVPWPSLLQDVLAEHALSPGLARALVRTADEYVTADGAGGSLDGLEQYLRAVRPGEDDGADAAADHPAGGAEAGPAVSVLTFHRAKGLEWPVVFVTGLEDGLVPSARAHTEAARAEEARLLYVALSRAELELHCSWAEQRTVGGRRRARAPSPWVATMRAAVVQGGGSPDLSHAEQRAPEPGPGAAATALSVSRRRLAAAATRRAVPARGRIGDRDDLSRRLDRWRRTRARTAGIDPDVVLDEALLGAIAETRPADREALAGLGLGPVATQRFGDALLELVRSSERGDPS